MTIRREFDIRRHIPVNSYSSFRDFVAKRQGVEREWVGQVVWRKGAMHAFVQLEIVIQVANHGISFGCAVLQVIKFYSVTDLLDCIIF